MIAPVGGVLEEFVATEVLEVDVDAAAVAAVDGVAAHDLEVVGVHIREVLRRVAHVDGLPHRGVLADGAPGGAHTLCGGEDLHGAELQEDRRHDLPRELQPVARRRLVGRHCCGVLWARASVPEESGDLEEGERAYVLTEGGSSHAILVFFWFRSRKTILQK